MIAISRHFSPSQALQHEGLSLDSVGLLPQIPDNCAQVFIKMSYVLAQLGISSESIHNGFSYCKLHTRIALKCFWSCYSGNANQL